MGRQSAKSPKVNRGNDAANPPGPSFHAQNGKGFSRGGAATRRNANGDLTQRRHDAKNGNGKTFSRGGAATRSNANGRSPA